MKQCKCLPEPSTNPKPQNISLPAGWYMHTRQQMCDLCLTDSLRDSQIRLLCHLLYMLKCITKVHKVREDVKMQWCIAEGACIALHQYHSFHTYACSFHTSAQSHHAHLECCPQRACGLLSLCCTRAWPSALAYTGLLLGVEAPVMTPNGVNFLFFSYIGLACFSAFVACPFANAIGLSLCIWRCSLMMLGKTTAMVSPFP